MLRWLYFHRILFPFKVLVCYEQWAGGASYIYWETPGMRKLFSKMWNDDAGIVAFEYLLVATILGLALVVGLSAVSAAINAELVELAQAILSLNQSYSVGSQSVCSLAFYAGSTATDTAQGQIGYGHSAATSGTAYTGTVNVDVCP